MEVVKYVAVVAVLGVGIFLAGCKETEEGGAGASAGASAGAAASAVEPGGAVAQTVCPVMGEAIDKNFFVDYGGQRIYFCCSMCVEKFQANPEAYMKNLGKGQAN